ncbi:MAG: hypothetical protein QOE90_1491 [Thermoplasmata archaeon]|jgi:hypothetical protein|nr:hypothetical protein [Thermoplasmata archaeon]
MTTNRLIPTLLLVSLLVAGCLQIPAPSVTPASGKAGGGALRALIVGVYQARVEHTSQNGQSSSYCGIYDWRIQFTTEYRKENNTYVYDTQTAQEFSVKTNDTALLSKLNATMRTDPARPAVIDWTKFDDPGCEYQHEQVVVGVSPLNDTTPTSETG